MKPLLAITQTELLIALRANNRFHAGLPGGRRALLQDRDFSGLDLTGFDFSRADVSGSRFAGVTAVGSVFIGTIASACDFTDADLSRVDFTRAVLCGSSLRGALLHDAIFVQADLRPGYMATRAMGGVFQRRQVGGGGQPVGYTDLSGARMAGANLRRAHLDDVHAAGTDFRDAVLTRANLSGALLSNARFSGSILEGVMLDNADLRDANFDEAVLLDVDLGKARGDGLRLTGAMRDHTVGRPPAGLPASLEMHRDWLSSAGSAGRRIDLRGADLRGTPYLKGALVSLAQLADAVLYQVDLTGIRLHAGQAARADFRMADLTKADVRGTDLSGARFGRCSGYRADFGRLPIDGGGAKATILAGANFRYADLREARFVGADLTGVDFSYADLTGADLTDADLTGVNLEGVLGITEPSRAIWTRPLRPDSRSSLGGAGSG